MPAQLNFAGLLVAVCLIGVALSACSEEESRHSATPLVSQVGTLGAPTRRPPSDGAVEDWSRNARISSIDFRAAHLLDVGSFLNEAARQDAGMTNVSVVIAVHDAAISSAAASKGVTLSLRDVTFLQVFSAVALQLGVDFKFTNGMVVFCDKEGWSNCPPAEANGLLQTEQSEVDARYLNVVRTNGSAVVTLAIKRWSKGLAFIDKSVRYQDGVITLSFQVVYNARHGGVLVDDVVRWSLVHQMDSVFRVIRKPDGIGHLDFLRRPVTESPIKE